MRKRLLLALLTLIVSDAHAQWRVTTEALFEGEEPTRVAVVEESGGHSLRVHRDANGTVWAIFKIRGGFDVLADESCPTYRIDKRRPINISADNPRCILEPKRAHFTLGDVDGGNVRSRTLLHLMNGSTIVVRYHLTSHGYRETKFTLFGSKQALAEVLGPGVSVIAE